MDSYLKIAEQVLSEVRIPMHPKKILEHAYLHNLVPSHLYGKTQHKTLQARLSEDIITYGNRSLFFRTNPGKFFLTKFISDGTIPEKFKSRFPARRRQRDLKNRPVLTVDYEAVKISSLKDNKISKKQFSNILRAETTRYMPYKSIHHEKRYKVWSFIVVYRDNSVLSYRQGRYREGRDAFVNLQAIGFPYLLEDSDKTLFDTEDWGLRKAGVCKAIIDIGSSLEDFGDTYINKESTLDFILPIENGDDFELVGVVTLKCPDWFEPTNKKLAINELKWLDITQPINNTADFDPWSKKLLREIRPYIEKEVA